MPDSKNSSPPFAEHSPWFRFECTGCGKCCDRPGDVIFSDDEIIALAEFLELDQETVFRTYFKLGRKNHILRQHSFRRCRFLSNDNLCKIYPVRPLQCRTYPFWPELLEDPTFLEEEQKICEGFSRGKCFSKKDVESLVRDHWK